MRVFEKDIKNRLNFKKNEFKILLIKSLLKDERLSKKYKLFLQMKLNLICKIVKKTKIRNFCLFSRRSRSILREFRMNRHTFKKMIAEGSILGIEKTG